MNVIRLKEDNFREALRLSEYAFQYKVEEERLLQQLTKMKESHEIYGIMEGEDVAAKLHLIPFHIYIGKEKFKMGGVAGVATYPEYRRSGYVKELLQYSLQTMKKDGYTVSMLHPFAVTFYRKYGWELCANLLVCHLTKSDLVMKKQVNGTVKRFNKENHPEEVEKLYETFAERFSGMLVRNEKWWLQAVYEDLTLAIYYDENKTAAGYMLYKIENYKMTVDEFVPLHNEARNGLWNFICQHDSMIKELEMTVSDNEQLLYTLQEPRVKTEIKPYFMGRIVDVEQFLKQYELNWNNVQQEVILHITDSFAPWNNVSVRLVNYEITIIEEPMDKGIKLDINALSTILLGYKRPLELNELELISGSEEEIRAFENVVPVHKPFIYDFF
ncbi:MULTISPECIES: enhanced intracellular survival protein Eis [Bacillus]|uniref:GNAT family N-acetyltransferase n=2 Tax=Bacillus cereus group TaxID=86661 RepID=A0A2A7DAR3_BACAN|nr:MULTISPECIES: GNAT family N-acetyltransferase [Bacillus]MDC7974987.1 GNAT family N-acetyltransferase [Bacillus sp. BLCC-B18]OTW71823.1 GNAT family N-acetyltransferase [Bacillus thuringiensis serovar coreanensis]OTX55443.1 GNAT family N-acetyltransferase [Bacillus thuringiensis serovar sooncheon]OTX58780.1 GNAT family N-acetyltransferase [Bacillus thuringiensis serovar guiyangiensis]OTX72588.1 GNAT family N-acetyltransferase [Bacillus thuringiensis serovar roskildiensis]